MPTPVCKHYDELINEKCVWFADLMNGERIYQDDDRSGVDEPKAWLRLRKYLEETGTSIYTVGARFRSNEVKMPPQKSGYYFAKLAMAFNWGGPTFHGLCLGYVENDKVHVTQFNAPALETISTDTREINPELESLIFNKDIEGGKESDGKVAV